MAGAPKRLAQRKGAAIDLTPCGAMLLHVGPMALKLEPAALVGLHELLGDALSALGCELDSLDPSPAEPTPDPTERVCEVLDQRLQTGVAGADAPAAFAEGFAAPRVDDEAWMERILRRARPDLID